MLMGRKVGVWDKVMRVYMAGLASNAPPQNASFIVCMKQEKRLRNWWNKIKTFYDS